MELTAERLRAEAHEFSNKESQHPEPSLFGVTDGKAVGTYLEAKFIGTLRDKGYVFAPGNAANGLDFPSLNVDIKVTSIKQPQSSCPFKSIKQRVYGLGYGLIVFVYSKSDDPQNKTATLTIRNTIFIEAEQTADFSLTKGLLEILKKDGNDEDLAAFMQDRHPTTDFSDLMTLAEEVVANPPKQGYLTISSALQWRLQYKRAIAKAGKVTGVHAVYESA